MPMLPDMSPEFVAARKAMTKREKVKFKAIKKGRTATPEEIEKYKEENNIPEGATVFMCRR
jgi:hypothetical protein